MLRDAATVEVGTTLEADVCIIGAGPAGMTVALELMQRDLRILMLEAGDEECREPSRWSVGSSAWTRYPPLRCVRREGFGGTSLAWLPWALAGARAPDGGLRCYPLQPLDFEAQPWLPNSGWPFGLQRLTPYYERAHAVLGLGTFAYGLEKADGETAKQRLPLNEARVETTLFRFAHTDVFRAHRPALIDSHRVTVMLRAGATEIEARDHAQHVSRIRVRSPQGEFWVRARLFVVAAGGIENARLLLTSNRACPAGLGNGNDLVGRFFMEHLTLRGAQIVPRSPSLWHRLGLYHRHQRDGVATLGALRLSEAVRREESLLGVVLSPFVTRAAFSSESVFALVAFIQELGARRLPDQPLRKLRQILAKPAPPAYASYLWLTNASVAKMDVLGIHAHFEQAPDRENRVTLSNQRNATSLFRPRLRWRLGEMEARSVRRTLDIVHDELKAAGVGEIKNRPPGADVARFAGVTHHHMGTTRMHNDPKHGVVDEDCKVHGISNLFVAGSSVFPTGGAATATLTLVALAIRLADHLTALLSATSPSLVESH